MSRLSRLRIAGATAATLAGVAIVPTAFAASASAATLSVDKACYVTTKVRPDMTITGAGFTPGDKVTVSDSTGEINATATADAAGQIAVVVKAPAPDLQRPGAKSDTVTAADVTAAGPTITATASTLLSATFVGNTGTRKRPGLAAFTEKTRWSFSGFITGRTIYGHYTYDGRYAAKVAFGRATGPCGLLTVSKRLYPATPHHQAYEIQVDNDSRYSRRTYRAVRLRLALSYI